MRINKLPLVFVFLFLIGWVNFFPATFTLAVSEEECQRKKENLTDYIGCLTQLAGETQDKAESLAKEVILFNTQIALTAAQISQSEQKIKVLEEEIASLASKIGRLDSSLNQVSAILVKRISETYKTGKTDSLVLFLSSDSFSRFLARLKYLKVIQLHDKKLLLAMEETKTNYESQKSLKEKKQAELEQLKKVLESQKQKLAQAKKDKEYLLAVTKQDEKRYQQLLASAKAELEALQAIMAGKGTEVEVGKVESGAKIALLIPGASCNSSGEHLHFMAAENGEIKNPFNYLKAVENQNCSGSSCGNPDGDSFNPAGDWDWPLNPPITLRQGFGKTWAVGHSWVGRIYSSHNGIDIQGSSAEVRAVKGGMLYRGSYTGMGGCRLQYVKIKHDGSNFETYYVHVYYL